MNMSRNVFKQVANKASHDVPIIDTRNMTSTSNNSTSLVMDTTAALEETIGTVLGGLGIFIILVCYIWWEKRDYTKRKEKALQETKKEERKRKLLKDSMNIETCVGVSTPCIDDEEAQHDRPIFKRCEEQQQDKDEYCSTTDDTSLDDHSHSVMDQRSSCSKKTQLQDFMCPICHEQYQDGDELASSRNEACCHTAFHSECIISWLMTDHKECPICRSEFVVEN